MTMLSFRVDKDVAIDLDQWALALGVDRSRLLRDALDGHLARVAAEHEAASWVETPRTDAERSLSEIADWGPAEDWSDWADATR